ncbi:protein phosphatase [Synechococcus sp. MU1655]|uniref:protein phosphatase n=1 Tax=Synechococcus sp. MU1655 TaxID=2508355 RepID=UPI00202672D3|nr:protein phosphatase [Synechococcus sp. MU1655]
MFDMSLPDPDQLQGTLVDFALLELIRQHRLSFQPIWTVDGWAKLMIWLALNCGLSGDTESLEHFATSLGETITTRMRRTFFERELADLELHVLADPADTEVLLLSQAPQDPLVLAPERLTRALKRVDLLEHVTADQSQWQALDGIVAIPWKRSDS